MTKEKFYACIVREKLARRLRQTNTPCYLFFQNLIRQRIGDLKNCLKSRFSIHYALKANPHPVILRMMADSGLGADVASAGELEAALDAGIPAENIEFSGPGKTENELMLAVNNGIGSVNAETLDELRILARLSGQCGISPNVGIRVNPDFKKLKSGLRMAGDTQFGIPEDQAEQALHFLREHSGKMNFTGIHVHAGSQILDARSVADNIRNIMDVALNFEKIGGLSVGKINFGGGWGVNYFPNQEPLDLNLVSAELDALFQKSPYQELSERTKLIVEPGRFLVAEGGIYVTKLLYRKQVRSKEFAIADGGMHQNYLLAGGMGQVIKRNFEMDILPEADTLGDRPKKTFKMDIAGKLCTPQDILAVNFGCESEVFPGDYVIFLNCGAYGLSASPVNFLSHPLPEEVFCPS